MASNPSALVITGFGLNCEDETSYALASAGAQVQSIHLNDLLETPDLLDRHQILALIGGFSFGDHMAAGRAFATRLRYKMEDPLRRFIEQGKLVIGICNGFQIMVKLGILPCLGETLFKQEVSVIHSDSGVFRDDWVTLKADPDSPCIFTQGLTTIELPIRHGEGKFVPQDDVLLQQILDQRLACLTYVNSATGETSLDFPYNPNGSVAGIAGLCSPSGRIFGLMPHPEAFHSPYNHPHWVQWRRHGRLPARGDGLKVFDNAVRFARSEL